MSNNNNNNNNNGNNNNNNTSSTTPTLTKSVSIPGTAAAGGITVTQPPSTASASFYKIQKDSWITFGWNLTSLYVTPSRLTVIASCSANGNTYLVGPAPTAPSSSGSNANSNSNSTGANVISANQTSIVWNPWDWEQEPGAIPFAEATYVLKIWDERGPDVGAKGGYLSPYAGTQFALYRPQGYTSIANGWTCQGCSSAMEVLDRPANIALFTSLVIVLFSAWNVFRR